MREDAAGRRIDRRELLTLLGSAAVASVVPGRTLAQRAMPARAIPSTGEPLPIVGLGSTRPVSEIAALGAERVGAIVRALVDHGGKVVDTWPRNADSDSAFGRIIGAAELRERLFVTVNLEHEDRPSAIDHFEQTLRRYGRDRIDLVNVGSLTGLDALWPTLKEWKEAGRARYIGVTAARSALYDRLEAFLRDEAPDFVEINYSVTERDAERRLLPLLAERGIAVLVSRPFMNGAYFDRLENVQLPEWTAGIECESWAQFSLQYILASSAVTCVLTETTNPAHMTENARTALKRLPDEPTRERMRRFIDEL